MPGGGEFDSGCHFSLYKWPYYVFFPQIGFAHYFQPKIQRLTRAFQDTGLSLCKITEKGELELRKHMKVMDMRGALVAQ